MNSITIKQLNKPVTIYPNLLGIRFYPNDTTNQCFDIQASDIKQLEKKGNMIIVNSLELDLISMFIFTRHGTKYDQTKIKIKHIEYIKL